MKPLEDFSSAELTARRHVVYLYLLDVCLRLKPADELAFMRRLGYVPDGVRRIPSNVERAVLMPEFEKTFDYDLRGVAGFYYDIRRDTRRELALECGIADYHSEVTGGWNLNAARGFFKPYHDERGRISGLYIFHSISSTFPALLSSEGLPLGEPATHPLRIQRSLAA